MPKIKKEVKTVKSKSIKPKTVLVKKAVKTKKTTVENNLTVQVYDSTGKKVGTQKLPQESFTAQNNNQLLSQAVRVYETNILTHNANTKTRGEIRGGGAKPWRQKGTGNARAGSKRSPLWVGGGITFGPRSRKIKLSLPQKMKHKALSIALTQKSKQGGIHVVADLEKIKPKTKIISSLIQNLNLNGQTLLVISSKNQNINLASRNIQNLSVDLITNLNAYQVIRSKDLIFSKEAISTLK